MEGYINDVKHDNIFLAGDFNAYPFSGRAWRNLSDFMVTDSLKCFDVTLLEDNSCSFVGCGNAVLKWLDHIIGKEHSNIKVTYVKILNDIVGSDRVPLLTTLQFFSDFSCSGSLPAKSVSSDSYINWGKLTSVEINDIMNSVDVELMNLCKLLIHNCLILDCRDKKHLEMIDAMYENITFSVQNFSHQYAHNEVKKK